MADITKCTGEGCPMKRACYRFRAPDNSFRQSYFIIPPIMKKKDIPLDGCSQYWEYHEKGYSNKLGENQYEK